MVTPIATQERFTNMNPRYLGTNTLQKHAGNVRLTSTATHESQIDEVPDLFLSSKIRHHLPPRSMSRLTPQHDLDPELVVSEGRLCL